MMTTAPALDVPPRSAGRALSTVAVCARRALQLSLCSLRTCSDTLLSYGRLRPPRSAALSVL